jgi:hypothetical protein
MGDEKRPAESAPDEESKAPDDPFNVNAQPVENQVPNRNQYTLLSQNDADDVGEHAAGNDDSFGSFQEAPVDNFPGNANNTALNRAADGDGSEVEGLLSDAEDFR